MRSWGTGIVTCLTALAAWASDAGAAQLIGYDRPENRLVTFRDQSPLEVNGSLDVRGLPADVRFVGVDVRPATGGLYGLGTNGVLYRVDAQGLAIAVGATGLAVDGSGAVEYGVDFDPVTDRLRVVSGSVFVSDDLNARVNPDTAATVVDTKLAYRSGDPQAGVDPTVIDVAYSNNAPGATSTTLYDVDSGVDVLSIQNPPNTGRLSTVARLTDPPDSSPVSGPGGFDITPDGQAFLVDGGGATSGALSRVNLATGSLFDLGLINGVDGYLDGLTAPRPGEGLRTCTVGPKAGTTKITGTAGDDVICGSGAADAIYGLGGNDVILARGGNDRVYGGPGNDSVYGDSGADRLYGEDGADRLHGGRGADDLTGGAGDDDLRGDDDNDHLLGQAGQDTVAGGAGADQLDGGAGADTLTAGDANAGPSGVDVVHGGTEDDVIFGGPGNDLLVGDAGNDIIRDTVGGDDRLLGAGGNDVLSGGSGRDQLSGAAGNDTLDAVDDPPFADVISCGAGVDALTADSADPDPGDCP